MSGIGASRERPGLKIVGPAAGKSPGVPPGGRSSLVDRVTRSSLSASHLARSRRSVPGKSRPEGHPDRSPLPTRSSWSATGSAYQPKRVVGIGEEPGCPSPIPGRRAASDRYTRMVSV